MFGLFDPPRTRAQKRAARRAHALREQAVRDATIELGLLIRTQELAFQVRPKLYDVDPEAAARMAKACGTAQETIDRASRFSSMFSYELAELTEGAVNAFQFEAIATFELEGRDFMIRLRDEAKAQLIPLSTLVAEARKL